MTYEEWVETFKPIKNHINTNAAFDGLMFETFGPELDFVRSRCGSKIWTWIEGVDGQVITDGYHLIKRLGYFITEVPHALDEFVEINLDD